MLCQWDSPPAGKFQSAGEVTDRPSRVIAQRFPSLSSKEPPKSTKYPTGWWDQPKPLSSKLHGQNICMGSKSPVRTLTGTEQHCVVRGWNSESCAGHHERSQGTRPSEGGGAGRSEAMLSQLIVSPQLLLPRDAWVLH